MPLSEKYLQALIPSLVIGNFTTICSCKSANSSPSFTIPSKSKAFTSALTSPSTKLQMST